MRHFRFVALTVALVGVVWVIAQLGLGTVPTPPEPTPGRENVPGVVGARTGVGEAAAATAKEPARTEIAAESRVAPRLTLRVSRSDTGEVLPDLPLTLMRSDGRHPTVQCLRTDLAGIAAVEEIVPGQVFVTPGGGQIEVAESGTTHREIVLEPRFEMEGIVVDVADRAIAGAAVVVATSAPGRTGAVAAMTGPDGRFRLTSWATVLYVFAKKPGYAASPAYDGYGTPGSSPPFLHIALRQSTAAISGTVVDDLQRPVAGARVTLRPPTPEPVDPEAERGYFKTGPRSSARRESRTDRAGRFHFDDLAAGAGSLRVRAKGFSQKLLRIDVEPGPATEVTITLDPPLRVLGHIMDDARRPLVGAIVSVGYFLGPDYQAVRAGPDGSYVLQELVPGSIDVTVSHSDPGYAVLTERLTGEAGEELRFDPVLHKQPRLQGLLVDESGEPLSGWHVVDTRRATGSRVDHDGRFELVWAHAQPPELVGSSPLGGNPMRHAPSRPLRRDADTRAGRHVYRPVPGTEATARIRGRALLPESSTTAPVLVTLRTETRRRVRSEPVDLGTGSFDIGPVAPAMYVVDVGGDALPRQILGTHVLRNDQALDLGVVDLRPQVPLQVTVRRSDGRQVTWLRSRVVDARGEEYHAFFTGGLFQVEPLLPGRYELMVYSPELQCQNMAVELISGEPKRLDVVLQPGSRTRFRLRIPEGMQPPERVRLTVRDDTGRQVAAIEPLGRHLLDTGESCAFGPGSYQVEAAAGPLRGAVAFTVPDRTEEILEVLVDVR